MPTYNDRRSIRNHSNISQGDVRIVNGTIAEGYEDIGSELFSYSQGRMFEEWIDTIGRTNGYNATDLITNPVYILESLIREEIQSEIDLIATVKTTSGGYHQLTFDGTSNYLISTVNDYYNNAYLINLTQDWRSIIVDYVGSTKTVYVADSLTANTTDKYKVVNINPSIIDTSSFDLLGHKTTGTKKDWSFTKSINKIDTFTNILSAISLESFTALLKQFKKYKSIPVLESKTTEDGTFSKPLIVSGLPLLDTKLTPIRNIYSAFEIEYSYNYMKKSYDYKLVINQAGSNESGYDDELDKIKLAVNNYKINRKFVYSCEYIFSSTTLAKFAKKLIDLYTKQRLIVTYTGNVKNHVQYEIGDVVLIDYPKLIPNALNNSAQFQIMGRNQDMTKRNGNITFTLIEV